ncbi:phosphoribosylformylglycinamidine synthase [Fervidicella metallireducens AeB]|uniref:Phosphoribosylformylglycinamidine synthase n=2 Tax=Fervidicella TaxID=1403538 RepID=A0A017RWV3_9CLOT|nr:phosphoribosylformylglycinamidine synthase [Fervidicella metallireducens AeB]
MNDMVRRLYVEKKEGFNVEAKSLLKEIKNTLGIKGFENVRIFNRYDISGINDEEYLRARNTIFSEPPVDNVFDEHLDVSDNEKIFAIEYLPGQYDQRADSASQCVQILTQKERPIVHSAKVIVLKGDINSEEFKQIKGYCINPVDSREASLEKPSSLELEELVPEDVEIIDRFINMDEKELKNFLITHGLAMSFEDLVYVNNYFKNVEKRNPSITEIKVIDTYWSDHCRHTTFHTKINKVDIKSGKLTTPISISYENYLKSREFVYGKEGKDISLMDIAVIGMKELRKKGLLDDLDVSDEINACSIVVDVDVNGASEKWLVMFKNETHNHPTEIEPFGGAATCLGGAIRDPLSGRGYVYQAMRVTGSGDPRTRIEDTLPGKLPQRKITTEAANGYSSYGNQIGLATGQVAEIYDEGFIAKRMEVGAVIAAAPKENVVRERPVDGDVVILVGGRTGRDGCGGATGSSKEHNEESILTCGAEVQKGNAPTERKIQRLFRNPEVSRLIKKCNDFGAGGVSVAIGELTDGLEINLDLIPKKYEGLDGTELAISESQERMAVVVSKENAESFIRFANEENLEATIVAEVKSHNRLKMTWRGKTIVDISRDFLNTNGVKQETDVVVETPIEGENYFQKALIGNVSTNINVKEAWLNTLMDLNVCGQKGLVEKFDSTIGAGTVIMPFGGKYQLTPSEAMIAKIPILKGETKTATIMSYGYNPKLAKWSPFHGAVYSIVEAVSKIVAVGGDYRKTRLSLQEYFEKLGNIPEKWGKPFSALLGAYYVQNRLNIPAIGGKDSMSGTFKNLDVPPTLIAFAVNVINTDKVISPEFKNVNSKVVIIPVTRDEFELPDFEVLKKNYMRVYELINEGMVNAAHTIRMGGVAEAISKMSFGNKIGFKFINDIDVKELFTPDYGSIILEMDNSVNLDEALKDIDYKLIGETKEESVITICGLDIKIDEMIESWMGVLENIFPIKTEIIEETPIDKIYNKGKIIRPSISLPKPRVLITVFPGTNCEYDSVRAFEKAGAHVDTVIFRNLSSKDIEDSIDTMVKFIDNSQIIMIPGGFSAGDEPDGSGKFIATVFRNPRIKQAVMNLIKNRDGLMLGICNGFQALIKLGLVPYGEIVDVDCTCPTLTYNKIGRHQSKIVRTKVVSNLSPWFNNVNVGDIHTIPISHGEGRFIASKEFIENLFEKGQISTQYVDFENRPTYDIDFNPNGSYEAIEGITSPDGRILGKMAHSERIGDNILKNIPGNKDQRLFEAGVNYFK